MPPPTGPGLATLTRTSRNSDAALSWFPTHLPLTAWSNPGRGWHCTRVPRTEDARQQPMDKVLFMIYGITWLIGVSLPLLVLWIYRTLQQIRCLPLPAFQYFCYSSIVFGSLLFLCPSTIYHIWALSLKIQTQVIKRKSKSDAVSSSRYLDNWWLWLAVDIYIIIKVVVSRSHALPVFRLLRTGPHPNPNNTPEIDSTR